MTTLMDPPATSAADAPPRAARAVRPAVNAKLAALAVGIIVLSVAGAAALFSTVSGTSPVVMAAEPLAKGQLIDAGDLTTAAVAADPTVQVVPGSQLQHLVGQRAAVDVPAGALLTPGSLTSDLIPGPGQSLIGVPVTSSQAPLADLPPGTRVRLVQMPEASATGTAASTPAAPVPAIVVSSGFAPDGMRVIDVTVDDSDAAEVTAWAAAGRAAVVVDTAAR